MEYFKSAPSRDANIKRYGWNGCRICGKPLSGKNTHWIREHNGGMTAVTPDEAKTLDAGADLGCQPIGPDCWKRLPQLHAYEIDGDTGELLK